MEQFKIVRDNCLVNVVQTYGGSIVQPQKGLSAYTISIMLKTISPNEERLKERRKKREFPQKLKKKKKHTWAKTTEFGVRKTGIRILDLPFTS